MRSFIRYILMLVAVLAALTAYLPRYYDTPYPGQPSPIFDNAVRSRYKSIIEDYHIEVALVGDSALEQGVDGQVLSKTLGKPSYAIAVPGSTSAFWYLILKNIILEANPRPGYVILLYRDTILTLPDFHVKGGYVTELDQFATAHEDVLLERAYMNFMNPLEKMALTYFPPYISRQQITSTVEYYARNVIPSFLLPCKGDCLDRTHAIVFDMDNMDDQIREEALVGDEGFLFTPRAMDFNRQVERSFLPEIIRLARENRVRLILVHERTLLFSSAQAEPTALQEYKQALAAYLKDNDVPLLDFSYDPRLPEEYFVDVLHMNDTGKAVFTQLLAEALMDLMQAGQ